MRSLVQRELFVSLMREDRGQSAVEYVGVLFVVAAILAGVTVFGIAGAAQTMVDQIGCSLLQDGGCGAQVAERRARAPQPTPPAGVGLAHSSTARSTVRPALRRKCHGGFCGLEFSKRETVMLYRAAVAGGTAAAATACTATGVPVACVAAASFIGYLVAEGTPLRGRCLFFDVGLSGTRWSLERC